MSDERPTNQGELVLSSTGRLTTRSAGLVRRGLDSLLAEQQRREKRWNMYTDAGNKAKKQWRYDEAGKWFLAAIEEAEGFGPWDLRLATSLGDLANYYCYYCPPGSYQGWPDIAEPFYQRALTIRENVLGPEHPETFRTLNSLALCYTDQGKYAESEPLFQRLLASQEKALGAEHPNAVSFLSFLAECYNQQGKYAEAEPLYQRLLTIYEKEWEPWDLEMAYFLEEYAALLRSTDRNPEAEGMEARARAVRARNAQENAMK